jgi:hypothetical protein
MTNTKIVDDSAKLNAYKHNLRCDLLIEPYKDQSLEQKFTHVHPLKLSKQVHTDPISQRLFALYEEETLFVSLHFIKPYNYGPYNDFYKWLDHRMKKVYAQ